MSEKIIVVGPRNEQERKRRRRELLIALLCFALIGVLTYIQLSHMGMHSYLFLGLFNLNFILLLLVLFIVGRNGVKLLLERRRRVLGSKMRTRLVLTFVSLSLIPTVLMFLVSIKFIQTAVDYWFRVQVEDSMEQALNLGQSFYRAAQEHLTRQAQVMVDGIRKEQFAWGGKGMDRYLKQRYDELDLNLVGVITPDGDVIQNQHLAPPLEQKWAEISDRIKRNFTSDPLAPILLPVANSDIIVVFTPVDKGRTGSLILGQAIGQDVHHKLQQVITGLNEYKKLHHLKNPWKMTLYLTLSVMTLLIVLGAVWFGFRLTKELSAPIQALAAGTERVARGDLSVRLEDHSDDEMGSLVQSFNRMIEDLRDSQERLETANTRLEMQKLKQEERGRYIEAVLDNITSGVISLDREGCIQTVNRAAQRMLGAVPALVLGLRPAQLVQGQFATLMDEALEQVQSNPASQWQRQLDLTIQGRDLKLLINIVSLTDEHGGVTGTVAVFEDITELEKMQRTMAWREVARRIAHEIKNPLTPIKLSAQRLQRRYGSLAKDATFEECTRLIVSQVERIQQMVTQFSAYAKLPEVLPRPDTLPPLLKDVLDMFRHAYRKIDWRLDIKTPLPQFSFDREALRRVFVNLLTNAAEAIGGQKDEHAPGVVTITAEYNAKRNRIVVEIWDNGPGFSQAVGQRLFEPYFSHKNTGTGLGLTIVRSIVNDHKGSVTARSASDKGAVFTLILPA